MDDVWAAFFEGGLHWDGGVVPILDDQAYILSVYRGKPSKLDNISDGCCFVVTSAPFVLTSQCLALKYLLAPLKHVQVYSCFSLFWKLQDSPGVFFLNINFYFGHIDSPVISLKL